MRRATSFLGIVILILACSPAARATPGDWSAQFDGLADVNDEAVDVAAAADGSRVYVLGTTMTSSDPDDISFVTLAFDAATGERLWEATYLNGSEAKALVVSPVGDRVFVTGAPELEQAATVAYDAATGEELWSARFGSETYGSPTAIAVGPGGARVFVTGSSSSLGGPTRFTTDAYAAADGRRLWTRTFASTGPKADRGAAVDVSPDGASVAVTGKVSDAPGEGGVKAFTVVYGAQSGLTRWSARYGPAPGGSGGDRGEDVDVVTTPQGRTTVYVAVSSGSVGRAALAYRARDGHPQWEQRHDVVGDGEGAAAIGASPDGGTVYLATRFGWQTIAYRADDGRRMWLNQAIYENYSGYTITNDLAVGPLGGRVYTIGLPDVATATTLGLRTSDGKRVWERTVDGAFATAIDVSPAGTMVIVVGRKVSDDGMHADLMVWAYSTSST